MKYVLGIDQGGTHTRAALADLNGRILTVGRSKGACHSVDGMDAAMGRVRDVCDTALSEVGVGPDDGIAIVAGMTGADWPDEFDLLRENMVQLGYTDHVTVHNDAFIAMRGGTNRAYGAIVVAGTGANCIVLAPSGETIHYHYYVEHALQGAIALGRQTLVAVYRAATGREEPTSLTAAVLAHFGLSNVDALLRADVEDRLPPQRIRELSPLVFEIADTGDSVARDIVRRLAAGLGELVTAGLRKLKITELEVEVVTSGSVFRGGGNLLIDEMLSKIHAVAPRARLVHARYEPVVGAVLLGLEKLGIAIEGSVRQNIDQSCQSLNLIREPKAGLPHSASIRR